MTDRDRHYRRGQATTMRVSAAQQPINAAGAARLGMYVVSASPTCFWSFAVMAEPTTDHKHGRPRRTPVSMP